LTLWLNNLIRSKERASRISSHVRKLLQAHRSSPSHVVMVSNELGLGLVPGDSVSREFRDLAGRMNQLVAAEADEVHFLVSGIPLRVK
jgi:adenosylcobinamide kinase/adenosylcobinamide-phosphate guanylyltransferase